MQKNPKNLLKIQKKIQKNSTNPKKSLKTQKNPKIAKNIKKNKKILKNLKKSLQTKWRKKMLSSYFSNIRRMQFEQSSSVQPFAQSWGGPLSVKEQQ